jgi:glycosyltransferase 2 family protein
MNDWIKKYINHKLHNLVTLGTSLAVIGVIIWITVRQWNDLLIFPWKVNIWIVLLIPLIHSVTVGTTFWTWHLMVKRLGGFGDLRSNLYFYYISHLAKRLPTSIPYIGGRLVMYKQVGVSGSAMMNCIVLENLLIGIAGVLTFLVFLPFYTSVPAGIVTPMVAVGLVSIGILLIRPQLLVELTNWILRRFKREGLTRVPNRSDILTWTGIYILTWLLSGVGFWFAPRAVSTITGINLVNSIEISSLSTLASLLYVVIPGGLALKEVTSSALMTIWMPFSAAMVITMIYRLLQTVNEIVWAVGTYLIFTHRRDQAGEPLIKQITDEENR